MDMAAPMSFLEENPMKARITLQLTKEGQLEILLNEAGRNKLVEHLRSLSRTNDHFHMAPAEFGMECAVSEKPYRASDQVLAWGKILLRPDDWDAEHFPHVLENGE